ncbi:MAG: type II secretion system F family protein [Actinobacteria bacterium]|nr:type II secretion system F family protein [Actinomycetota bacterium]
MGNAKFGSRVSKLGKHGDLKLLFKEEGEIRIYRISIKSLHDLFIMRVVISLTIFVACILFGLWVKKNFIFYALGSSLIAYFLPMEMVKSRISSRRRKVLEELPDVVDILSSLVNAGLSLDEAVNYISLNFEGEVSKLFRLVKIKVWEGYGKKEAFYKIARLSFCSEFNTIVKLLVQSDIVGNPIRDVLKELSRMMRDNQRDVLKMKAERLEGNLILIVFIFVFIPVLVLFLLPVLPQLKMLL